MKQKKTDFLKDKVLHFDIEAHNPTGIIDAMASMGFSARETANAAKIMLQMQKDPSCTRILVIAGSTSAAGCLQIYVDLVEKGLIDVVVATGASIVDMDFFEAIGFNHYVGSANANDRLLRSFYIDRIYDTYINEDELQFCDQTIKEIADHLEPGVYPSYYFIHKMGQYLKKHFGNKKSLIQTCAEKGVPIFCPAFSDCSAGFGLVAHQEERIKSQRDFVRIDSVSDFRSLTKLIIEASKAKGSTGLFMIGGGVPKNFIQDTVVAAEMLGTPVPMHKYAVQITVADPRDGACSSSTLSEAQSWGKVDTKNTQMVYAEATTVLPLIAGYVWHNTERRLPKNYLDFLLSNVKM